MLRKTSLSAFLKKNVDSVNLFLHSLPVVKTETFLFRRFGKRRNVCVFEIVVFIFEFDGLQKFQGTCTHCGGVLPNPTRRKSGLINQRLPRLDPVVIQAARLNGSASKLACHLPKP